MGRIPWNGGRGPAPYVCMMVSNHGDPPTPHCLSACTQGCDCAAICLCKGVNGNSDWGLDGFCVC